MTNRTLPLGLAIIAAGIIILLGKLGFFTAVIAWFWPLAPIALGVWLHTAVWRRRLPDAAFVPGALLVGAGIACLLCAWFGWYWMRALWPLLPLSLAVGLYEFSASQRESTLRTAAYAIGGVSLLALLISMFVFMNGYVVALLLIAAGVAIVARRPFLR